MKPLLQKNQIIDDKYEVKFFLSETLFYQEYRVKDRNGKTLLLKLYNSSKLSRYDFSKGKLLEVEILTSLNIENIVKLIDSGEFVKDNQKYHYIVFNFISGESLKDKFQREGVFSAYSAVPTIIYLLEILSELHKKSPAVIHNNINLESVFLDYSNAERPVLTDFCFARYITSKSNSLDLTRLNPFYIAPELYNGIFTPQSDIFSVGALLYNMIVGIPPWYIEIPLYQHTRDKFINAINTKRTEELTFGIKRLDEFDDEHLKEVIKKALAVNIDDRFKNTDEFIKALKRETVIEGRQKTEIKKVIKKKGEGFSAIAGMKELKEILYNDVIRAIQEKELYEQYGLTIPNGMLLYGPPGCGKTYIAERFAEEVGFNFLELKPSDIKSKYVNATEEKIGEIFKEAEKKAPTIIFIDEIDAVVPNREGDLHQMHAAPVNEFLTQLNNCGERGIFVIAATNRPEKIDPAILRRGRIDKIIYVSPPDFEARSAMFKLYLKNRPVDLGLDYDELARKTENYVSSDIKFIVDEASRMALQARMRITQEIFNRVIKKIQPSVSNVEVKKYERLKTILENKGQDNNKSNNRKIGFQK